MTARSRRRWSILIRYTICVAAVTWLVVDTDWDELRKVVVTANWPLALTSVLVFGPAPLIISIRLKLLLAVHKVHLTVWQAIKVTFAGNFIINALPVGTPGGDAAKAYYVARDTPHKHEAVTTVLVDRLIGVVGLVGLASVVLLVNWGNPAFAWWGRMIAIAVVVVIVGAGIYFSHRMRGLLRLEKIVAFMPLASHMQRIDRAAFAFRHRLGRLVGCLVLSVILQLLVIVSLFLAGWALGIVGEGPWSALPVYLGYTPICLLAGVAPIGVMEEAFRRLFVDAANLGSPEAARLLSLLGRLIQLVWALPGAAVVLSAGRPGPESRALLEEVDPEASPINEP
jgi:uncharacterized membrane protein YbhN (UPF0104 family)